MHLTVEQFHDLLVEMIHSYAVPKEAQFTVLLGYLQSEVVGAMNRMTPEEQEKFFPGLKLDLF